MVKDLWPTPKIWDYTKGKLIMMMAENYSSFCVRQQDLITKIRGREKNKMYR